VASLVLLGIAGLLVLWLALAAGVFVVLYLFNAARDFLGIHRWLTDLGSPYPDGAGRAAAAGREPATSPRG
jgi:hypothetical protein